MPALASADFLELLESHLEPALLEQVKAVGLTPSPTPSSEAEARWSNVETYIRNCLVQVRAAHAGADKAQWLHPEHDVFPGLRVQVDEAVAAQDPLSRERMLDEIRWQALTDFEAGHEFDYNAIVIYRLKLLLVEKWGACEGREGVGRLVGLADQVMAEAD